MENEYAEKLVEWFSESKRIFPWRVDRSPYSVLVSEIMLQQTKAAAVIPYFNAWMEKFPDFNTLAKASVESVIKMWEGLGYYSRAKNLREIAIAVVENYEGVFPDREEEILSFKGIGPYTCSAILHFAFDKKGLGADGNIKKVMARFFGSSEIITKDKNILVLLDSFLPETKRSDCFEGLIELGATICSKRPLCQVCPLAGGCVAYNEKLTHVLPVVKKRVKITFLFRVVFIIERGDWIYILKEEGKLMNGLYSLPYIESDENYDLIKAKSEMEKKLGLRLTFKGELENVTHSFTRYKAHLKPIRYAISKPLSASNRLFLVNKYTLPQYPFSSGYKTILKNIDYTLAT